MVMEIGGWKWYPFRGWRARGRIGVLLLIRKMGLLHFCACHRAEIEINETGFG